jgi:transcription initiation factor TFIID TATA-box-binding protein
MTITTEVAPDIDIQNVVTTATFPHSLDLDEIAASLRRIEINPRLRSCIMYRMEEPEAVLWIYSRGLIVTASARSEKDSVTAIHNLIDLLDRMHIPVNHQPVIAVRNILANVSLGLSVNLEKAALLLEDTLYEPEQFPGLIYRPVPDITVLIFNKGKMVITGAQFQRELQGAVETTIHNLTKHDILEDYI